MTLPLDELRRRDFKKILLIKMSAVGDVMHTMPVLNKLRRRYPAAQLDWLLTTPLAELLRHNPAISNVIEFARGEWTLKYFLVNRPLLLRGLFLERKRSFMAHRVA